MLPLDLLPLFPAAVAAQLARACNAQLARVQWRAVFARAVSPSPEALDVWPWLEGVVPRLLKAGVTKGILMQGGAVVETPEAIIRAGRWVAHPGLLLAASERYVAMYYPADLEVALVDAGTGHKVTGWTFEAADRVYAHFDSPVLLLIVMAVEDSLFVNHVELPSFHTMRMMRLNGHSMEDIFFCPTYVGGVYAHGFMALPIHGDDEGDYYDMEEDRTTHAGGFTVDDRLLLSVDDDLYIYDMTTVTAVANIPVSGTVLRIATHGTSVAVLTAGAVILMLPGQPWRTWYARDVTDLGFSDTGGVMHFIDGGLWKAITV